MPTFTKKILGLGEDEHVTCRCIDGRRVAGTITNIERDQVGICIELRRSDERYPTYRIRLTRSSTEWLPPYVDRREATGWTTYGELVNFE